MGSLRQEVIVKAAFVIVAVAVVAYFAVGTLDNATAVQAKRAAAIEAAAQ